MDVGEGKKYSVAWDTFKTLRPLLAVVVFIIGLIGIEVWNWVFEDGVPSDPEIRSAMVRNFALIGLGFIGLPLAVWRTYTAHRQAAEAARQGERTERQLALTSEQLKVTAESNHAELLQRSADLLDMKDKERNNTAVAFLIALAEDEASSYSTVALSLLKSIVNEHEYEIGSPSHLWKALEWLDETARRSDTQFRTLKVTINNNPEYGIFFKNIFGIRYVGGLYWGCPVLC
ncbi:hypothetical protein [Nitratireductor sp. XY-223]|uniref:hypothetical protein n=1 Tax=Nitratireductor sp. XY-223 TaxID=2561926 RepID=UPI0010AA4E9C|nr:hypothetical protein [Nitratireductor sp. XY-223]